VDVVIHPDDYSKSRAVFESLGGKHVHGAEFKHVEYELGGIHFELHFILHRFGQSRLQKYCDAWTNKDLIAPAVTQLEYDGKEFAVNTLTHEWQLVHLLLHFVHHVIHEGCGLRQLIDFALTFQEYYPSCNHELLVHHLEALQLTRAFHSVLYLCLQVLGMPINFDMTFSWLEKQMARKMEKRMMHDGNFGRATGWEKPKGLWGSVAYNLRSFRRQMVFFPLWPKEELLFPLEVLTRRLPV
jgi:hypothetical protein